MSALSAGACAPASASFHAWDCVHSTGALQIFVESVHKDSKQWLKPGRLSVCDYVYVLSMGRMHGTVPSDSRSAVKMQQWTSARALSDRPRA